MAQDLQEGPQLLEHVQVTIHLPNISSTKYSIFLDNLNPGVPGTGTEATGGTPGSAGVGETAL